ncbi:hypothetical protein M378DRAFT_199629 [Amanita muscaria Koide BX008]|uniref:WD40 repeat-like protein n=1 Tax=Amanita muscaria (strain Koide BX008) TaxID=946122 RepID=A0A0C2WHV6_AMAMK|nr:hypothetical protein M378DRAFT_199629 [Amanita muscaria Koide BX008]
MSLVELLLKHGDKEDLSQGQSADSEDGHVPSVDDHLQTTGAEVFCRFQKRINNLDKELRNFANSARQLGSSVAILSSTFHLRERLAQLLYLYHENAARLFPRMVSRADSVNVFDPSFLEVRRKHWKRIKFKGSPHVARPMISEKLEMEQFPHYFEALAKDVTTFLHCLNEFPEFTDEAVNISIMSFEGDLKYWSSCLQEYRGQFRHSAVQRYIHDLSSELGEHIDNITAALSMFVEVGVPTIRFAQKHGAMNLLNLSTIATFFSAVTATCLQYSFNSLDSSIAHSVNGFWFASLVFSIAAAVNSLLGLTWKQAMYRSPGHRVPWWVLIWIKRSPLVFLVISNACFSIGLCCFTYSSGQHYVTSTITTVFTAFTSFGLVAVSTWFASERWAFQQHEGKKWLSDILIDAKDRILQIPPLQYLASGMKFVKFHCTKFLNYMRHIRYRASDLLPTHVDRKNAASSTKTPPCMVEVPATPTDTMNPLFRATTDIRTSRPAPLSRNFSMPNLRDLQTEESTAPRSPKELWDRAFSGVLSRPSLSQMGLATAASSNKRASLRQLTASSNLSFGPGDRRYGNSEENSQAMLKSRITALISDIKPLEVTQDLAAHEALVRHLQFSPDGKYLATSSWDKTTTILRVGEPFVIHRIIAHSTAQGLVGQVAWSPCGKFLLTRLSRGIKIWSALDGSCNMIDRPATVQAVAWFPRGEDFISIEGNSVTKMNICGNVIGTYHFGNMKLQDVAVSTDSKHLLGVGPLLESPTGLQPSKSRAEKRLAVFNMEANQIESMTPVLDDVKHVTLASTRHGLIALVSYDCTAPQVWMLESFHRDGDQPVTRLTLKNTYLSKTPAQFTGPSYFGGKNNEVVLSADKAGVIHIWDQEAGVLLHRIQTQSYGGNLTCMAWSASDSFMLATGTHDGSVRIWTSNTDRSDGSFMPRSTSPTPFLDIDLSEAATLRISPARSGSDMFPSYTY